MRPLGMRQTLTEDSWECTLIKESLFFSHGRDAFETTRNILTPLVSRMGQLFLSHAWCPDELARDNHARVERLLRALEQLGWSTWYDENNIQGNMDASVADGIEAADAVIVCLTRKYCEKINQSARSPWSRDWCLKEWTYANARRKLLVPVIMEPSMKSPRDWPVGTVLLELASQLCVDASYDEIERAAPAIHRLLSRHNLSPHRMIRDRGAASAPCLKAVGRQPNQRHLHSGTTS